MVLVLDPTPISYIVTNQVKWDMRTHNQEENFKNSGMTVNSWGHALKNWPQFWRFFLCLSHFSFKCTEIFPNSLSLHWLSVLISKKGKLPQIPFFNIFCTDFYKACWAFWYITFGCRVDTLAVMVIFLFRPQKLFFSPCFDLEP